MRIVYIVTRSDTVGGVQVHVRDLALALRDRGHEATVIAGHRGVFTEELGDRGVAFRSLPHLGRALRASDDARALTEIRAALAELEPDLVSTHAAKAGCLGRIAARSLGIPAIFTAHGWSFTDGIRSSRTHVYRWVERLTARFAKRIITVSEYDRQLAVQQRVALAHKLVTVHNGVVDVPAALHASPGRSPVRLVMVARFEEQKDHATLFRALAGLREQPWPWQLELIGDGPLFSEAVALAQQLEITPRIQFVGFRRDVMRRLAEAQVFLLITNWEGFPRSILEAMRAGLPVVASDVGGNGESVVHGETGFLVPRGDVSALRTALARLLADPDLRVRMGSRGRRRFEERFTLERMCEKTFAVYREVMGGGVFAADGRAAALDGRRAEAPTLVPEA
ncbi:MAG TPA: glycosyltransferase family 4 protein [Gemmatimonadaceae bacterium]|nr:glycosyltransferase family 4 protein [Gemmatimonadaceae bacterium]